MGKIVKTLKSIGLETISEAWVLFIGFFKKLSFWLFGGLGSFCALYFNFISGNDWQLILIIVGVILLGLFIGSIIISFIKLLFRKYSLNVKESVYGRAIILLSEGFAKIHALKKKEKVSVSELKVILSAFCDSIKKIYDYKTQENCSVSIKVFTRFYDNLKEMPQFVEVKNLIRDSESKKERDKPEFQKNKHHIHENTCYQTIISNFLSNKRDRLYFLNNDLPGMKKYENSSFRSRGIQLSKEAENDEKLRRSEWRLGYRSELVVALTPINHDDVTEMQMVGFICVDCPLEREEVFSEEFDVPLLRGVADGLYDLVKEYFFEDTVTTIEAESGTLGKEEMIVTSVPTFEKEVKILFLSANPSDTARLKLGNELRSIKDCLSSSTHRDRFLCESESAVKVLTITKAMQTNNPQIVHFSGHGKEYEGLVVEDSDGNVEYLDLERINRLFKAFKNTTQCVMLNACYSKEQAQLISKYNNYVIGMNNAIDDEDAARFSTGFYQSLGEGRTYREAFEMALVNVPTINDSQNIPELWYQGSQINF